MKTRRNIASLLFIAFAVLGFISCTGNGNQSSMTGEPEIRKIDLSTTNDEYALYENIYETKEVIPLESKPECMIKSIRRILPFQGNYYVFVLDGKNQECVLVFDSEGHYLHKIGTYGHGHGEYATIKDFCIDEEGKRVIILSANSTVYVYQLDGKFLFTKVLDKSLLWSIAANSEGFLLSSNHQTYTTGENAFLFYQFDKDFNLKKKTGAVLPEQMYAPWLITVKLCTLQDKYVYHDAFTFKTSLLSSSADPETCYDFQFANPMPQKSFTDGNTFMAEQMNYDYLLDNVMLNDRIITFYVQNGKCRVSIADKSGNNLLNKLYGGMIPNAYYSDGEYVLTAFSAHNILQMKEWGFIKQNDTTIEPEDNLVILRLKPII